MPYRGLTLIGLTGNIACGKSTVLQLLHTHGAATIDADAVTHALQQPGQPVYQAIVAAFGDAILSAPGGPIDRRRLAAIVFADPAELRRLEQIVHPAVHAHLHAWLAQRAAEAPGSVAVIDAVKLLEAGWKPLCDAVWVVTCTPEQQLARLVESRGMTPAEAEQRIAAQPSQAARVAQADLVIDNSGSLAATAAQVAAGWQALQANRRQG
ncbi:MAG TPA: dephospho-CoA kinase [Roseiflexaceae bacterium]|nr:dephospho-CoA kinase [Roseiflexaceae bacterium]HMP38853.1 dephospho-CoA kinase [Roseiflexaceae bacterium]